IDAVAQAGRAGAVGEDVAEMAVAFRAQYLGADHAVADIALLVDMAVHGGRGEARPAAAGIELGIRFEQRLAAAGAGIGARAVLVLILAGKRPLGRLLAQHGILHRRQFLAPFGLALDDLAGCFGVGHLTSFVVIPGREANPESRDSGYGPSDHSGMTSVLVRSLGVAHQRRLLDVILRKDLLQILDLRNVVERNIGLVRVQRQVVLVIV